MLTVAAISLSNELEKIGSFAGLAAFFGFAVLTVMYFAQAREVKRLREWAGRAPERAAELEHRVVAAADARRVRAEPVRKPATAPATPAGVAATQGAAAAGAAPAAAASAAPAAATGAADGASTGAEQPGGPAAVPAAAGETAQAGEAAKPAVPGAAPGAPAPAAAAAQGAAPAVAGAAQGGAGAAAAAGAAPPGSPPAGGAPAAPGSGGSAAPGAPSAPAGASAPSAGGDPSEGERPAAAVTNGTSTDIPAVPPRATPRPVPPARPLPPRRTPAPAAPLRSTRPTATPRRAGAVHASKHAAVPPDEGRSRGRLALISGASVAGLLAVVLLATQLLGGEDTPPAPNVAVNETPTPAATQSDDTGTDEGGASTTRADVTVAVLNGTTTPGLAATVADRIAAAGFAKGTITNFTDSQRSASLIFYAPGQANPAREVSRVLRLRGADRQPMNPDVQALSSGADVVVVVGADQTQ